MTLAIAIALIVADAAAKGVALDATYEEEAIWIASIEREGGRPGSGADVLLSLMEISDDHGVPLRASIVRDHERLLEYYGELGFEAVSHDRRSSRSGYTITIEYAP